MSTSVIEEPAKTDFIDDTQPAKSRPSRKRWLWLIVLVLLASGAIAIRHSTAKSQQDAAQRARVSPLIPVVVDVAKRRDMPVYLDALGNATAFNTVLVKTRVDGQLVKVNFQEGQLVRQGDLVAEIDPRPFEVQLEQAEGQLAKDQAQLDNAKTDLTRYQTLLQQDAVPQQQLATQQATVAQLEGTLKSDQAAIDNARLQLKYCHIEAPLTGRIGLRQVDPGNMIHTADPNGLVVITQLQPISVLFSIPEDNLPPILQKLNAGEHVPVDAFDRSGSTHIATGILSTVDNQIDPTTGTLRLKAVFDNQNGALFPNQFVNVKLLSDVIKSAVIVPVVAIQRGPQGTFVFVVSKDQTTVSIRPVKVRSSSGDSAAIDSGLSAGEAIVVDGMDKLRDGSKIHPASATPEAQGGERKQGVYGRKSTK